MNKKFSLKGRQLKQLKITIKPLEWHFIPYVVGKETPNIREIYFLCFRINLYAEDKVQEALPERYVW